MENKTKLSGREDWCISNCTKGYEYDHILGMNKDKLPCARNCCKEFCEATQKKTEAINNESPSS